jgi:hypothetical protein
MTINLSVNKIIVLIFDWETHPDGPDSLLIMLQDVHQPTPVDLEEDKVSLFNISFYKYASCILAMTHNNIWNIVTAYGAYRIYHVNSYFECADDLAFQVKSFCDAHTSDVAILRLKMEYGTESERDAFVNWLAGKLGIE